MTHEQLPAAWRLVREGLRYSDECGSHPGTPILLGLLLLGGIAGRMMGVLLMGSVFVPLYLVGAYERGKFLPPHKRLKR